TGGELDEGAAVCGRAVAPRRAPHRMGESREIALHPAEPPGGLDRLLLVVGDGDLDQGAPVFGATRIALLQGDPGVQPPDLLGLLDRGVERNVGIALLRRPDDRLLADHARDPDARIGLLQWHGPRVDHTMLVVRAFKAERAGLRPRLDDQLVRLLEALAVE